VLLKNYDTSVWQQLLPKMFRWKEMPYTDQGPLNTLRNFTFFIPNYEGAQWEYYVCCLVTNHSADHWSEPAEQTIAEAKSEVLQLQTGTPFQFRGHDFTGTRTIEGNPPSNDFGPGPISVPQPTGFRGNSGSFYTITGNSKLEETLYRYADGSTAIPVGYWHTWAYPPYGVLYGDTIHEWALVTSAGEVMGQVAADQLFGTGSIELASPDRIHDSKDSSSYTYDFKVQSGGLATRLDVFSNWGQGVDGFSPRSFRPAKDNVNREMSVDPNPPPYPQGYFNNIYADYKITYGSNLSRRLRPGRIHPFRGHQA
jgi:hypothetical protein